MLANATEGQVKLIDVSVRIDVEVRAAPANDAENSANFRHPAFGVQLAPEVAGGASAVAVRWDVPMPARSCWAVRQNLDPALKASTRG